MIFKSFGDNYIIYTPTTAKVDCFFRSTDYISPAARKKSDGTLTISQRFWKNSADVEYAVAQIGRGRGLPTGYGIDIRGDTESEVLNTSLRSLRWHDQFSRSFTWPQTTNYDGWLAGPYTDNFSELKTLPYVVINDLTYSNLDNFGGGQAWATDIFRVTTSSITWGTWITVGPEYFITANAGSPMTATILREK